MQLKLRYARFAPVALGVCILIPRPTAAQQYDAINRQLNEAAQQLAGLLGDSEAKGAMLANLRNTLTREKVLVLHETVPSLLQAAGQTHQDVGRQLQAKVDQTRTELRNQRLVDSLDVYLPVRAHRQAWLRDGGALLVTYSPAGPEPRNPQGAPMPVTVPGYPVGGGAPVQLSTAQVPTQPVLVIAAEEHPDHRPRHPRPAQGPDWGEPRTPLPTLTAPQRALEVPPVHQSWIGVVRVMLLDDGESWLRGDPEIYCWIGQSYRQSPITHKVYLDYVNAEDSWYSTGSAPSGVLFVYFNNTDYSDLTVYHFMEEDEGDRARETFTVGWGGFSITLPFFFLSGDDDLGWKYVHKSSIPWSGWVEFNTGKVRFKVDKAP